MTLNNYRRNKTLSIKLETLVLPKNIFVSTSRDRPERCKQNMSPSPSCYSLFWMILFVYS